VIWAEWITGSVASQLLWPWLLLTARFWPLAFAILTLAVNVRGFWLTTALALGLSASFSAQNDVMWGPLKMSNDISSAALFMLALELVSGALYAAVALLPFYAARWSGLLADFVSEQNWSSEQGPFSNLYQGVAALTFVAVDGPLRLVEQVLKVRTMPLFGDLSQRTAFEVAKLVQSAIQLALSLSLPWLFGIFVFTALYGFVRRAFPLGTGAELSALRPLVLQAFLLLGLWAFAGAISSAFAQSIQLASKSFGL